MSLAKNILGMITGAYLALHSPAVAKAANVNAEVAGTRDYSILDLKISGELNKSFNHYIRNFTTIDHENSEVSNFSFGDVIFPVGKGFDILTEAQFPVGSKIDFRAGIQYFTSIGDLLLGGLTTRSASNHNTELLGIVNYTPEIGKNSKLIATVESLFNIGDKEYNFDSTKLRLGIKQGSVAGGAAAEISGLGNKPNAQVGVFISKDL